MNARTMDVCAELVRMLIHLDPDERADAMRFCAQAFDSDPVPQRDTPKAELMTPRRRSPSEDPRADDLRPPKRPGYRGKKKRFLNEADRQYLLKAIAAEPGQLGKFYVGRYPKRDRPAVRQFLDRMQERGEVRHKRAPVKGRHYFPVEPKFLPPPNGATGGQVAVQA